MPEYLSLFFRPFVGVGNIAGFLEGFVKRQAEFWMFSVYHVVFLYLQVSVKYAM